jgi:cell division transport system permease protein
LKKDLERDLFAAPKLGRRLVNWLRDHIRVAHEVSRNVSLELFGSFLTWFIVGLSLSFPAGLYLAHLNAEEVEGLVGLTGGVAIYFQPGATESEIAVVQDWVARNPELELKEVRSSEKAFKDLLSTISDQTKEPNLFEGIDYKVLPVTMLVELAAGYDERLLVALKAEIEELQRVDSVAMQYEWLERLAAFKSLIENLWILSALLFGLASVLVTSISISFAIQGQLEELKVFQFLGATKRQVRRPFIYLGAIFGIGGGLIALFILALVLSVIEPSLSSLYLSYGREGFIAGFDLYFSLILILCCLALGIIGASLAASRKLDNLDDLIS